MLRSRRLGHAEGVDQLADGEGTLAQQVEDRTSFRLPERRPDRHGHGDNILPLEYTCQRMYSTRMALTPFLMFTGRAEEAMRFYVSVFPDAEVVDLERYGPDDAGAEGNVRRATFQIAGQSFLCIDSPAVHDFGFTPSVSFFLDCPSEGDLDALFDRLSEGGSVLMPAGEYPFARRFAWLNDRFGVSWQLNVARV